MSPARLSGGWRAIGLHDAGWLPGAVSDALRLIYAPLHWLMVVLTGCCNG